MAKIEFEAFIEAWTKNTDQHPAWGMKTAETHSRKNDDGKYETFGRTFRTVKVSRASGVDLTQYVKGSRVKVVGTEQTETREHEGKKFYDLIVWADRVELIQGQQATTALPAASQAPAEEWSQPNTFDASVPF
jgi:single-stranded DNA-binding protein